FFRPLHDAFKAFGLDHRNDGDWHSLALHLARVLFARGQPGRQKKWTDGQLFLLLAQVASYKRQRPKASDADICRWLHRKGYFSDVSSEALRRALQDARNPKRNSKLAHMADSLARAATRNWTGALDEATIAKWVSQVIENANVLWVELRKYEPRK